MTKKKMAELVEILGQHDDLLRQRTIIEDHITSKGHVCLYLPKFHPELSFIELAWCTVKKYLRKHCGYSFPRHSSR